MKLRKLLAVGATGFALALGAIGGTGVAAAGPFEGHWDHCSGLNDGSICWTDQTGIYNHLDLGEGQ